jgi:hypothetical protein
VNESNSSGVREAVSPVRSWARPSWLGARYSQDHNHPVNHFLHVGVGWPMAAIAVVLLPFRPVYAVGLFACAYAVMFVGHFAFERNIPTVFKQPGTPFVIAWSVIRGLVASLMRLATPERVR